MNSQNRPQQGQTFAAGYIDVATRIQAFRAQYPGGCLRPVDPTEPVKVITMGERTYLQYVAAAYRSADDSLPGIGIAWEPYPGKTPYTRDSEAMVAETSAWGRAIVAVLAADTRQGIASADEVAAAKARQAPSAAPAIRPAALQRPTPVQASPQAPGVETAASDATVDLWQGPPVTDAQLQRIGILRREAGLDDAAYRKGLDSMFSVASTKELTTGQAKVLIEKLAATAATA